MQNSLTADANECKIQKSENYTINFNKIEEMGSK